jgi:hypothetical protein
MSCPSISSLLHELFEAPWADDDPEFIAEVKRYESTLKRMLSLDAQLTRCIQSQVLLESDQIAASPVIQSIKKTQLVASCQPVNHQVLVRLVSDRVPLTQLFSRILLEAGSKSFQYLSTQKPTESITAQFDQARVRQVTITATWNFPLLQLHPPFQKFIGAPIALAPEIATKILAHIDERSLYQSGEVKCDGILRALTGLDKFPMSSLPDIIERNTRKLEPLMFSLELPQSSKAFSIVFPEIPVKDGSFSPMRIPPPPIHELLETALQSKEQLLALDAFEKNPDLFVDEMVLREARMQKIPEVVDSSYFFLEPWVLDTAADLIKSSEYVKTMAKRAVVPPQKP